MYEQAAHALLNADFVLIAAGAGFSADSGLPVYKDVANLPAYRDAGLDYGDLCVPQWARRDPTLFFGFWGSCYNNYFDASPHDGYGILHRWTHDVVGRHLLRRGASATGGGAEMGGPPTSFVYTSNVDCFFRRAGWDESQMLEIHGNISRWQCSLPCRTSLLAPRRAVWTLPPSHRFEVDPDTMRAPVCKAAEAAVEAGGGGGGAGIHAVGGGAHPCRGAPAVRRGRRRRCRGRRRRLGGGRGGGRRRRPARRAARRRGSASGAGAGGGPAGGRAQPPAVPPLRAGGAAVDPDV